MSGNSGWRKRLRQCGSYVAEAVIYLHEKPVEESSKKCECKEKIYNIIYPNPNLHYIIWCKHVCSRNATLNCTARVLITALHVMQTRYSEENCLSVCLSVCHTRDPWQNAREICPDFYTIRKNIYPSFLRRRMVGGERSLLPEILGQPTPVGAKSPIFNQ